MFKKILYGIIVIGIIIILSIMWTKNDKEVIAPVIPITSEPVNEEVVAPTEPTIAEQIDNVNVDSGIDTDMTAIDTDIKTL